ncbi:hypothetical protein Pla175_01320 [Pirellulimonas nuda]|uniref:Uncharacterized protein n=1 Tax=Pirellulimonas nuda TaxID=2528009 RepID=A0A518D5N1_9BACT|nr:hypothetical protein Pla175_01320 [Pirellulimonas nuda]
MSLRPGATPIGDCLYEEPRPAARRDDERRRLRLRERSRSSSERRRFRSADLRPARRVEIAGCPRRPIIDRRVVGHQAFGLARRGRVHARKFAVARSPERPFVLVRFAAVGTRIGDEHAPDQSVGRADLQGAVQVAEDQWNLFCGQPSRFSGPRWFASRLWGLRRGHLPPPARTVRQGGQPFASHSSSPLIDQRRSRPNRVGCGASPASTQRRKLSLETSYRVAHPPIGT